MHFLNVITIFLLSRLSLCISNRKTYKIVQMIKPTDDFHVDRALGAACVIDGCHCVLSCVRTQGLSADYCGKGLSPVGTNTKWHSYSLCLENCHMVAVILLQ